jgi:hypothetical protein
MDKREQVIQLAKEIAEARQQLSQLEAQLDRLIGDTPKSLMAGRADVSALVDPWTHGSMASRVVQYLNAHPGIGFSTRDLFAAVGATEDEQNSVLATLSRLTSDGQIDRIDRGVYAAKGTHPL